MFSPPLRVHHSLSFLVAWTPLNSGSQSTPLYSTISIHGFSHLTPMSVRLLSHLRRFSFRSCAWSSLFGVSMNARDVATCPHRNSASLLVNSFLRLCHGYVLSPPWRSNKIQIPLECALIPYQFHFFLSGAISAIKSGLLKIRRHTHVEHG